MIGAGEPRVVKAGVVGGSYFEVMGLRPVLGRLLDARDDGPEAPGAAVLTYRFWNTALKRDPSIVGRTVRLGSRDATVVGVLEPSVPYPADTEIIANVVTSPHHLGATMVRERTHRMTELFGRLKPGVTVETARAELIAAHAAMVQAAPRGVLGRGHAAERHAAARSDHRAGADDPVRAARRRGRRLRHRVLQRREPDPGAHGAPRAGAGGARGARRRHRRAQADAARRKPGALRHRRRARRAALAPARDPGRPLCRPLLRARARRHRRFERAVDRRRARDGRGGRARVRAPPARAGAGERRPSHHAGDQPPAAGVRHHPDRPLVRAARRRGHAPRRARGAADREHRLRHAARAGDRRAAAARGDRLEVDRLLPGSDAADRESARGRTGRGRELRAVARHRHPPSGDAPLPSRATRPRPANRNRARGCGT